MKLSLKACSLTVCALLLFSMSFSQVGINTSTPQAALDIALPDAGLLIPRGALTSLTDNTSFVNPQGGNLVISTLIFNNGSGGVTTPGFYYWDGAQWIMLTTRPSTDWTINGNAATNPANNYIGSSDNQDVSLRRNSAEKIRINANETSFMDEIQIRDGAANSGDILGRFYDDADNGVLDIYQNNTVNHKIHGNSTTVFNELGSDIDLRIESNNNENAMLVDATNDAVIFGSTGTLFADNLVFSTNVGVGDYNTTIDYVADFDNGLSRGTTMGLGSVEFLVDGEAELFISDTFSPTLDLTFDLGFSNSWRNVYASQYFTISDINAKKEIKPMAYGLNEIMKLSTISYKLKDDPFNTDRIGVIAQEVKEQISEASISKTTKKKEDGTYEEVELDNIHVSYNALVPVLIKATQEQQEEIETLKSKINALETALTSINKHISATYKK